jgi:hypothetical protein
MQIAILKIWCDMSPPFLFIYQFMISRLTCGCIFIMGENVTQSRFSLPNLEPETSDRTSWFHLKPERHWHDRLWCTPAAISLHSGSLVCTGNQPGPSALKTDAFPNKLLQPSTLFIDNLLLKSPCIFFN